MKKLFLLSILLLIMCNKKTTVVEPAPEPVQEVYEIPQEHPEPMIVFHDPPPEPEPVKVVVVYFKFDSYELRDSEKWKISNIDKPVELTGGACPIGNDDYNYTLGLNRAYAVKRYFDNNGIKVLTVKSVGENELISYDKSEYDLNRRCEVRY